MMISSVMAALIGGMVQFAPTTPPTSAPSDTDLIALLQEKVPGAEVISVDWSPLPADGSVPVRRTGCGLARINGQVEPFSVRAQWKMTGLVTVRAHGDDTPPSAPYPAWDTGVSAPGRLGPAAAGEPGRRARNTDAVSRRSALLACPNLRAPEGSVWTVDLEPDPDPARQRRNEERAKALTDLLFGD